jgi:hypothetical protein
MAKKAPANAIEFTDQPAEQSLDSFVDGVRKFKPVKPTEVVLLARWCAAGRDAVLYLRSRGEGQGAK